MDVSRRGLFAFIAGAGAGVLADRVEASPASVAETTPSTSFPLEGREVARVSWFNRERGFGYMEGLSSFHRIRLSQAVIEQGGMEGVRPGQTLQVRWKIHRAPHWHQQIMGADRATIPASEPDEYGCIAYEARPTEPQEGTCMATVIWYQRVREFGFLKEQEGSPHIFVRKRLFDEAGIIKPVKGQKVWVYWKHTHKGLTAFQVRPV